MQKDKDEKEEILELTPAEVRSGIRFISNTLKQINKDFEEFNKRKKETEEKINNGARRTSGRII